MGKVSHSVKQPALPFSVFPDKKGVGLHKQKLPLYLDDTAANRKMADKRRAVCQRRWTAAL